VIAVAAPRRWLELPLKAAVAGQVDADVVIVPYLPHSEVHFDVRVHALGRAARHPCRRQPQHM
jgi:hypothetical protein